MRRVLDDLQARLASLAARGERRVLRLPSGLDFSSNDYLGLARDPTFAAAVSGRLQAALAAGGPALGAPASRLLAGHTEAHRRLEARFAAWKGTEAALLFPSGYQANLGLLSALIDAGDRVISDQANHASLIDGLRLARAEKVIVPHLDLDAMAAALRRPWPGRTYLLVESLYSMDGDEAPLGRIAELAERHGALLLVDDAHATGVFGERGAGLVEEHGVARRVLAVTSTGGKALGLAGGFVAGPAVVIDYLIHRCRPFLFTTAAPPLLIHALEAALDVVENEPARRARVLEMARRLRQALSGRGVAVAADRGPIVPVVLGRNERALAVAAELAKAGFDAPAVRPPTVPPGTARLRLSVHADHTPEAIDRLAAAIAAAIGTRAVAAAGAPA